MNRFLTFLLMCMIVLVQGSTIASATCAHRSGVDHIAARGSSDRGIAAQARNEEGAASLFDKKAAGASTATVLLADLPVATELHIPYQPNTALHRGLEHDRAPDDQSISPLLQPPTA